MPKPKIKYAVLREVQGGERTMFSTYSYAKARTFFNKHPRAFGIQKYQNGVTAGIIQPSIPSKLTVKGKKFERVLIGGHRKSTAVKVARDMSKDGNSAFARKGKHGWQVFIHFK